MSTPLTNARTPLRDCNQNAPHTPTPTQWLKQSEFVPYRVPEVVLPYHRGTPNSPAVNDSHTKRVAALESSINNIMAALMMPLDHDADAELDSSDDDIAPTTIDYDTTAVPVLVTAVPPAVAPALAAVVPPAVAPVRAAVVPPAVAPVVAAVVSTAVLAATYKQHHKHLYSLAKEKLELLTHGGLEMTGRGKSGTLAEMCSGFRYSFRCTHWTKGVKTSCQAQGFINSDFTPEFTAGHTPPTNNGHGAVIQGTGCPRYGVFRGLHASEVAVGVVHDTAAARTTTAKDLSVKILAQKVAKKKQKSALKVEDVKAEPKWVVKVEEDVKTEEDVKAEDVPYDKPPPTRRALRHWLHKNKGHEHVDIADIGTCQDHVEKHWSDKQKKEAHPIPCEVKVVHTEQWESLPEKKPSTKPVAPAPRKRAKTSATALPPSTDDAPHSGIRKNKTDLPSTKTTVLNSIIILSTLVLMDICKQGCHASVDGTYRCAPARSTIADFGVFAGRAYIPCFLGILTGPRSGDSSEHWGRFMAAVRRLLQDWCPRSCVRDHAACLINALNEIFATCTQVVCYFHLRQCLRRRKAKMQPLQTRYKEIMRLVDVLHYTVEENWGLARAVIDRKLPAVFKEYFYSKTGHGEDQPNEVWTHRDLLPGQVATNCATEMFHHTLRTDPDHFNGIMRPAYMTCLGLLGNTIGAISFQCSHKSALGGLHYTEHADNAARTRVRATWKAAMALCESGVLDRTHSFNGVTFYFLAGGKEVSRREVDRITSEKGLGAAQYLKFFSLRRVTEHACQCVPFLKFGYCRHVFAVQFRIHGLKIVPHGVISGHVPRVPDSDDDSEVGAGEGDDAESSDSAPDDTEDEIAPPMYTQRTRRPATIHNAAEF